MGVEDALARRGVLVTCGSVSVLWGSVRVILRLEVSLALSWPQELWGAGRVEVRFPRPSAGSSSLEMFVCLPVLGLRVFPVGSFVVAGTI